MPNYDAIFPPLIEGNGESCSYVYIIISHYPEKALDRIMSRRLLLGTRIFPENSDCMFPEKVYYKFDPNRRGKSMIWAERVL